MMEYCEKIKRKADKALEDLTRTDELELMKDSHRTIVKDLLKIRCMVDELDSGSYSNNGYSSRHYVRGHYSRDGAYDGSYDGSYGGYSGAHRGRGHYSRTDAKRAMMDYAEAAMSEAPDEMTRSAAKEFRDKIDRL